MLAADTKIYDSRILTLSRKQKEDKKDFFLISKLLRKFPVKYSSLKHIPVNLSRISGVWYINRVMHNNIVNTKAEQFGFFWV